MVPLSKIPYSAAIQGILQLDISREQRFRDDRKDFLLHLLRLRRGMVVADLGCGPGALTRKLASWLGPKSRLIGVDQDREFLVHARSKAKHNELRNVDFIEGDVLDIPLSDASVAGDSSYCSWLPPEEYPTPSWLLLY